MQVPIRHQFHRGARQRKHGDRVPSLGTEKRESMRKRVWRSFPDAVAFVRGLTLKDTKAWKQYAASQRRPKDIPSCPNQIYPEFVSWTHWLGTDATAKYNRVFRPFEEARTFARSLQRWINRVNSQHTFKPRQNAVQQHDVLCGV